MLSKYFDVFSKRAIETFITGPLKYRNFHENTRSFKKIKLFKRLASSLLFGSTFLIVVWAKKHKNKTDFVDAKLISNDHYQKNFKLYEYKGFVLHSSVMKNMADVRDLSCYEDDIFVVSFPKTGTTWVQEIIYCVLKGIDNASTSLEDRFPYLEFIYPGLKSIAKSSRPRMIKTHLPYSLLPKEIYAKKPKIIYVMRNMKDVCVSYYHFMRMMTISDYSGSFENFFNEFLSDKIPYGPIWKHYSEIWEQRDEDNVFIITYEELHKDVHRSIKKIATFLSVNLTDEEIDQIAIHCSFNNMKNNPNVNYEHWDDLGIRKKSEAKFMRKGVVGDWKNHFDEEMNKATSLYIEEKIREPKIISLLNE